MKSVFADSFYFIALLNRRDAAHRRASRYLPANHVELITTRWALAEVADGLSDPTSRTAASELVSRAIAGGVTVMEDSDALFERGLQLYRRRADKHWSLTDCISFVVMSEHAITEALTGDHHFEQAGFTALLR